MGVTICAEDARSLAASIEAELPGIREEQLPLGDHAFGEEHTEALLMRRAQGKTVLADDVRAARELLSGPPKRDVEKLTGFLQGGEFSVHAG